MKDATHIEWITGEEMVLQEALLCLVPNDIQPWNKAQIRRADRAGMEYGSHIQQLSCQ